MSIIKNTAGQIIPFFWGDASGNPLPGESLTYTVSINGADYGASSGTITEAASQGGEYFLKPSQADTDGDTLGFKVTDGTYVLTLSVPLTALARGGTISLSESLSPPRALDSVADASMTINDALWSAIGAGAGQKDASSGTTEVIKTPSTGTVLRTYSVTTSATNPFGANFPVKVS